MEKSNFHKIVKHVKNTFYILAFIGIVDMFYQGVTGSDVGPIKIILTFLFG